jgi:hypothetical protein
MWKYLTKHVARVTLYQPGLVKRSPGYDAEMTGELFSDYGNAVRRIKYNAVRRLKFRVRFLTHHYMEISYEGFYSNLR